MRNRYYVDFTGVARCDSNDTSTAAVAYTLKVLHHLLANNLINHNGRILKQVILRVTTANVFLFVTSNRRWTSCRGALANVALIRIHTTKGSSTEAPLNQPPAVLAFGY